MIILIGGESHTGKTWLAQRLLEKYHYPYMSLDHLKMGLIRSNFPCNFTALDDDAYIAGQLWGIIRGIVDTCLENHQNLIIEGCYLPPHKVRELAHPEIMAAYLVFSEVYIHNNFDLILQHESVIEQRKHAGDLTKDRFIADNAMLKEACIATGMTYFEIQHDYHTEIKSAFEYIHEKCAH